MNGTNRPIVITLIVVILVIAGLVTYFYSSSPSDAVVTEQLAVPALAPPEPKPNVTPDPEPEVTMSDPMEVEPETPDANIPAEVAEPVFVLPLLDDSDQLIRDGSVSLTRHEAINLWLGPDQLIRKFVAFVDNVAHGQVAKAPVRALAPEGEFLVRPLGNQLYELDPASYDRYNKFTEIAVSVDSRRAAEFYHLLRPLVHKAFEELGYGDRSFDDALFQAITRLLEAPVIEGQIRLTRPVVMYRYEDEKLENLSAVQKQMIRMGPDNTRLLQGKVQEIALELRAILER